MKTGRVIIWSLNRLKFVESVDPAMISSGAVSPMTRAMASVTPVMIPAMAVGSTTLTIVRHFGTPRAYDASRRSVGTSLSISSADADHDRDHQQRQGDAAAEAHVHARRPGTARTARRRTGPRRSRGCPSSRRPGSGWRTPAGRCRRTPRGRSPRAGPTGIEITAAAPVISSGADDRVVDPALLADDVAHRPGEEPGVEGGQTLSDDRPQQRDQRHEARGPAPPRRAR